MIISHSGDGLSRSRRSPERSGSRCGKLWEKESGGILAKDDLANLEGTVTEARGGGNFVVKLENGHILTAKLGGAMRRFRIRVISGDRVTIGVSPYDPTHGLILYRHKN